jgi:hypothetical protein
LFTVAVIWSRKLDRDPPLSMRGDPRKNGHQAAMPTNLFRACRAAVNGVAALLRSTQGRLTGRKAGEAVFMEQI